MGTDGHCSHSQFSSLVLLLFLPGDSHLVEMVMKQERRQLMGGMVVLLLPHWLSTIHLAEGGHLLLPPNCGVEQSPFPAREASWSCAPLCWCPAGVAASALCWFCLVYKSFVTTEDIFLTRNSSLCLIFLLRVDGLFFSWFFVGKVVLPPLVSKDRDALVYQCMAEFQALVGWEESHPQQPFWYISELIIVLEELENRKCFPCSGQPSYAALRNDGILQFYFMCSV